YKKLKISYSQLCIKKHLCGGGNGVITLLFGRENAVSTQANRGAYVVQRQNITRKRHGVVIPQFIFVA
ncbi:MAG: hypothetical protein ACRCUB_18240, partial [Plesiomonas shigelloides]